MRIILLISVCLLVLTVGAFSARPAPTWEYKLEYKISEKKANDLSVQGWELIGAGTDNAGTLNIGFLIFRRQK